MTGDLFFPPCGQRLNLEHANVCYYPAWLDCAQADSLQRECREQMPWEQPDIRVMGKVYKTPRQQVWVGNAEAVYRYSGREFVPVPWFDFLNDLRADIAAFCQTQFNSVLINRYRNGRDGMGFHADDEPELGKTPVIASLSLGASRKFSFKKKRVGGKSVTLDLHHGDLVVMSDSTQEYWLHGLPKTQADIGERINLTFRFVHNRYESGR